MQSVFRGTAPHPRADIAYANYNIGSGSEVKELIPGISLFNDKYPILNLFYNC